MRREELDLAGTQVAPAGSMTMIQIVLTAADPAVAYTAGFVIDVVTGRRMPSPLHNCLVNASLGAGTTLELPAGRYRYEFEISHNGVHTMVALDDRGVAVAPSRCFELRGVLLGWTYGFDVAS